MKLKFSYQSYFVINHQWFVHFHATFSNICWEEIITIYFFKNIYFERENIWPHHSDLEGSFSQCFEKWNEELKILCGKTLFMRGKGWWWGLDNIWEDGFNPSCQRGRLTIMYCMHWLDIKSIMILKRSCSTYKGCVTLHKVYIWVMSESLVIYILGSLA